MGETKKKNKVPGIILLVIGTLFLLVGIAMVLLADNINLLETEEPVDIYYATKTDEYSFASVQYMSDSVAYFEAMENMQFYIVCDSDWVPAVICLHTDELDTYQPYIDWMYSDSVEGGPEEIVVTGYAQPFDPELEQWVTEGFNVLFGEELADESNFTDWFGEYYLQIGQKNSAYGISKAGIYLLLAAVIFLVIGGTMIYEKPIEIATDVSSPIIEKSHVGLGILGALLGALLGGLAWTIIGALGYIVGWIGILIVFFAYTGYSIFEHKKDKIGLVVSIVFSILVIIPATYLSYGWDYYCAMNESVTGYTTLLRALQDVQVYLTTYGEWGSFFADLAMGYAFMLLAGVYYGIAAFSNKNKS